LFEYRISVQGQMLLKLKASLGKTHSYYEISRDCLKETLTHLLKDNLDINKISLNLNSMIFIYF
jgi:hypothetical protein